MSDEFAIDHLYPSDLNCFYNEYTYNLALHRYAKVLSTKGFIECGNFPDFYINTMKEYGMLNGINEDLIKAGKSGFKSI